MNINSGKQLLSVIHDLGLNCNQFSKVIGVQRSSLSRWINDKRVIPNDVREHVLLVRWMVKTHKVDPRSIPDIIRE